MKKIIAAALLLSLALSSAPVLANNSGVTGNGGAGNVEASPDAGASTTGTPPQPAATTTGAPAQPAPAPRAPGVSGIGVSDTGLPSNLPRLGLQGVTNPVGAVERILLNYVITPIFILAGGVAVIVIMYSAFQIITARGEEEGLSAAKTTLIWAFLGLGLVMLAYTIVSNLARIILQVL